MGGNIGGLSIFVTRLLIVMRLAIEFSNQNLFDDQVMTANKTNKSYFFRSFSRLSVGKLLLLVVVGVNTCGYWLSKNKLN